LKLLDVLDRIERFNADRAIEKSVARFEEFISEMDADLDESVAPVYFFNASTRIHRMSINASISLITSWKIRLAGYPVKYLFCNRGMQQCILGTDRVNPESPPPCKHCTKFSQLVFPAEMTIPITLDPEIVEETNRELKHLDLDESVAWEYRGIPIGKLCLPGLRWSFRRHHLEDKAGVLQVFKQYLTSAASLSQRFTDLFLSEPPRALVVFNGLTYPEAVARHVARSMAIPVFTHEVGLRPISAFYSSEHATFREFDLASEYQLTPSQNEELDRYLEDRFQGHATMAGIQFWPEMTSIPEAVKKRIGEFEQLVPIFTNVIFDTSQVHANTLYPDMFSWLEDLREVISAHPETLFILRAHPDEDRPGKESQESVSQWVRDVALEALDNVIFLSPTHTISSYEIINHAKFVLVYNSSIGLEASILGKPVLCAARARYTQLPTSYFPTSRQKYLEQLAQFLTSENLLFPHEFKENARRFLYYELYRASLDFSLYLHPYPRATGMVTFTEFDLEQLTESPELEVISNGILNGEAFHYSYDG
jgi:hypothetical protein